MPSPSTRGTRPAVGFYPAAEEGSARAHQQDPNQALLLAHRIRNFQWQTCIGGRKQSEGKLNTKRHLQPRHKVSRLIGCIGSAKNVQQRGRLFQARILMPNMAAVRTRTYQTQKVAACNKKVWRLEILLHFLLQLGINQYMHIVHHITHLYLPIASAYPLPMHRPSSTDTTGVLLESKAVTSLHRLVKFFRA